ncbi:MAG TPA: long-chain-fatty-acid--CoA ligase [Bryobacteraceae bacterium]|nr:long-chain-fatty-acid--CoA ligase [Bryobacteraceae bacterium]
MIVPLTPVRFLHRAMDLYGNKAAIVSGEQTYTYSEFGERCQRLATALECLGVEPGDRVAYLSFNNHQLLEGYFGVLQARAVVMPLNVRLAPAELRAILNHSGARVLMYEGDFAPLVEKFRPACPSIEKTVGIGDAAGADLSYEELLHEGRPERADVMTFDENATAELFYTSGSTGLPKGVELSHRTIALHALNVAACLAMDDSTVELHTIPLFHANGWGRPQIATLLGAKQVMVRRFEPITALKLIEQHRATDMSLVPTMAGALLQVPNLREHDVSSLRLIHIGGAASSPRLIEKMEKAFGCRVVAGYGLTETSPVISTGRIKAGMRLASDAERWNRQAMAGLPVPGVEVRVVDHRLADVARDMKTMGEIVVRGDQVMDAYYKDAEATRVSVENGWLHTGDMAVWDTEGYIHIVDRKKDIIVSGGENISSLEVERAIVSHDDVIECAVVSAPDEKWGEVPAAIVVRRPGSGLTREAIEEHAAQQIARFKLPRIIEIVDEPLPKTGTGKIRKLDLRERYWQGKDRRVS